MSDLPTTKNGVLKVELVPMPPCRDPWRTRGEYLKELHRDTIRFWVIILTLVVSIIGVVATAWTAIATIKSAAAC